MPKFTAQVKKVDIGKSFADPQAKITLLIEGIADNKGLYNAVAYFMDKALQENNYVELEYKGK